MASPQGVEQLYPPLSLNTLTEIEAYASASAVAARKAQKNKS
jgi:hypothetical protein